MSETWAAEAEEIALSLFSGGMKNGGATQLLEMTHTNRTIAGRKQGIVLATLRFAFHYYMSLYPEQCKYDWGDDLCDIVEGYQLTMSGEDNSRRQFMKVEMSKLAALFSKSHNVERMEDIVK